MSPPGTQRPCGSALGRTGAQVGDSLSHRFPVLCHCSMSAFRDKPENVCSFRALPVLTPAVIWKHSLGVPIGLSPQTARWKRGIIPPLHE